MQALIDRLNSLPWTSYIIDWAVKLSLSLMVLVIGLWIARMLVKVFDRVLTRTHTDPMLRDFLKNLLKGILTVVVIVGALDQAGVPMTSIFAALGAAGLAIALALRDSLSNLAAGVMLLMLKPFRAGDSVSIGGQSGKVESLRLMHTVLVTPDNSQLILPNNKVANEAILNNSARSTRRLDLSLGIAYKEDIGQAMEIIAGVLKATPAVLADPPAQVQVERLGENWVELSVRPWVNTGDYASTRATLLLQIKSQLSQSGIDSPMAQRELRVVHENAALATVTNEQLGRSLE